MKPAFNLFAYDENIYAGDKSWEEFRVIINSKTGCTTQSIKTTITVSVGADVFAKINNGLGIGDRSIRSGTFRNIIWAVGDELGNR